jgi:hypothetical protein
MKGRKLNRAIYFGQPCLYRLDGKGTVYVDFDSTFSWGEVGSNDDHDWLSAKEFRDSCPLEFALLGAGEPSSAILKRLG